MKIKNLLLIISAIFIYLWHKKREDAREKMAEIATPKALSPSSSAGTAIKPATYQAETLIRKAGVAILRIYGNIQDPSGSQRLNLDISAIDSNGLTAGDTVNLENSAIYQGYYKIQEMQDRGTVKTLILGVTYMGAEKGIYLNTEKIYVSPFTTSLKPKSSFL